MDDNYLEHHGIKGMKWYVRRYQNKDGTLTPAGRKRYNSEMEKAKAEEKILKNRQKTQAKLSKLEAQKKANSDLKKQLDGPEKEADTRKLSKKKVKDMTDDEIRKEMERLQLEKDYKQMLASTRKETISKGQQFIEDIVTQSGKNLGTQVLNYGGSKILNKVIREMFNETEDVIFTNNKKK